jgi:hypothetical protein
MPGISSSSCSATLKDVTASGQICHGYWRSPEEVREALCVFFSVRNKWTFFHTDQLTQTALQHFQFDNFLFADRKHRMRFTTLKFSPQTLVSSHNELAGINP